MVLVGSSEGKTSRHTLRRTKLITGAYGPEEIYDQIIRTMRENNPNWEINKERCLNFFGINFQYTACTMVDDRTVLFVSYKLPVWACPASHNNIIKVVNNMQVRMNEALEENREKHD